MQELQNKLYDIVNNNLFKKTNIKLVFITGTILFIFYIK